MISLRASALGALLAFAAATAGCGDDTSGNVDPSYDNIVMILDQSCGVSSSCHGGAGMGQARLNVQPLIDGDATVATTFFRSSCQYDPMPIITPNDPANSWLMIKVDNEADSMRNIQFTPDASWMPDLTADPDCPSREGTEINFGQLMPNTIGGMLAPDDVESLRQWIQMGAPGPS